MVDNGIHCAAVLEDDALVEPDFREVLGALMDAPGWDMVRFLGREKTYGRSRLIGPLHKQYCLTRPRGTPGGAYGYILTLNGARRLLGRMEKNWLPVDVLHGFVWDTGIQSLAVRPSPVLPDDDTPSTIGGTRFDKTLRTRGWKKTVYPVTRCLFRLYLMIMTRYSALASWPRDIALRRRLREKS
jgi:glycosyl transferase family 25